MRRVHVATVLSILLLSAPVGAADFTFNIPVQIENSIIWRIHIRCSVYENEMSSAGRIEGTTQLVGQATVSLDITDGEFDDTVTVEVDADPGRYPALARSYSCALSAQWPYDPDVGFQPGGSHGASPDNFRDVYESRGGRILETLENKVYGRIEQ